MIPSVKEILAAYAFLARRYAWGETLPDDDLIEALVDARIEAQRLALGHDDEVAALFFACAARSASLGEDFVLAVTLVTVNHAATLGRRPSRDPRRLAHDLQGRAREIGGRAMSYDDFRAWMAERLPVTTGQTRG